MQGVKEKNATKDEEETARNVMDCFQRQPVREGFAQKHDRYVCERSSLSHSEHFACPNAP